VTEQAHSPSLLEKALAATDAYARVLLAQEGTTWGPRYVRVAAGLPGYEGIVHATLGDHEPWRIEWGEEVDFTPMAENKLEQALRVRGSSSDMLGGSPWNLRHGDYLPAGGACTSDGSIAVGVSGALGLADEAIALVLLTTIRQLYRQWYADLRDSGVQRLPGDPDRFSDATG
jgi:hypothetical protein